MIMDFNINEIEKIINDLGGRESEDFEIWAGTLDKWQDVFIHNGTVTGLSRNEAYFKCSDFKKCGDYSEENFKKWFPNAKYEKYIDPNSLHEYKKVAGSKIQKVAFLLQNHISLSYNDLQALLLRFYMFEKKYTYEALTTRVSDYDSDLCLRMTVHKAVVDVQREKILN